MSNQIEKNPSPSIQAREQILKCQQWWYQGLWVTQIDLDVTVLFKTRLSVLFSSLSDLTVQFCTWLGIKYFYFWQSLLNYMNCGCNYLFWKNIYITKPVALTTSIEKCHGQYATCSDCCWYNILTPPWSMWCDTVLYYTPGQSEVRS